MTRKEANLAILAKLTEYVMLNDYQRFGQILRNIGIVIDEMDINKDGEGRMVWNNHFYEDSFLMLKRMEEREKRPYV